MPISDIIRVYPQVVPDTPILAAVFNAEVQNIITDVNSMKNLWEPTVDVVAQFTQEQTDPDLDYLDINGVVIGKVADEITAEGDDLLWDQGDTLSICGLRYHPSGGIERTYSYNEITDASDDNWWFGVALPIQPVAVHFHDGLTDRTNSVVIVASNVRETGSIQAGPRAGDILTVRNTMNTAIIVLKANIIETGEFINAGETKAFVAVLNGGDGTWEPI